MKSISFSKKTLKKIAFSSLKVYSFKDVFSNVIVEISFNVTFGVTLGISGIITKSSKSLNSSKEILPLILIVP